ncbi:MAG: hypothetical protein JWN43_4257 [Gammaproteobacteria bacterium]|nr:hypothetical protein [Gammaproteobacteria bacterium]
MRSREPLTPGRLFHRSGTLAITPLSLGDFFSVDCNVPWRFDADTDLRPINRHDGYLDVVADPQGFTGSSGQYQHDLGSQEGCRADSSGDETPGMWAYGSIPCRTSTDSPRP